MLRRLAVAVTTGAALGAALHFSKSSAPDAAPAAAPAAAATEVRSEQQAAVATAATPQVSFPDGTQRPVLNGVTEPVELDWPVDTPYSPVVATVRDGETEWFQHEDGSWSTTLRRQDKVSGRWVTLCPVYQKGPNKPVQLRSQQQGR